MERACTYLFQKSPSRWLREQEHPDEYRINDRPGTQRQQVRARGLQATAHLYRERRPPPVLQSRPTPPSLRPRDRLAEPAEHLPRRGRAQGRRPVRHPEPAREGPVHRPGLASRVHQQAHRGARGAVRGHAAPARDSTVEEHRRSRPAQGRRARGLQPGHRQPRGITGRTDQATGAAIPARWLVAAPARRASHRPVTEGDMIMDEHPSDEDLHDTDATVEAGEVPGVEDADVPGVPDAVHRDLRRSDELEAELLALNEWVTWLRTTYGLPASVIPPFWHRHDELRWELSALHLQIGRASCRGRE